MGILDNFLTEHEVPVNDRALVTVGFLIEYEFSLYEKRATNVNLFTGLELSEKQRLWPNMFKKALQTLGGMLNAYDLKQICLAYRLNFKENLSFVLKITEGHVYDARLMLQQAIFLNMLSREELPGFIEANELAVSLNILDDFNPSEHLSFLTQIIGIREDQVDTRFGAIAFNYLMQQAIAEPNKRARPN